MRIAPLRNKDAHLIPKLIESGMNRSIFPLTIFSSKGYEAYINNLLTIAEKNRRVKLYGAFVDDHLAGYTEWRILEESLFLNNIYVFPEYQGFGFGKSLLVEHGKDLLHEYEKSTISLDVFADNKAAIHWYEKIGFINKQSTYWYVGEQTARTDSNSPTGCYVENYPNAEAEHKAYGFSMLTCSTRNGSYQIGRIKNQYYRITNPKFLHDYELLHYLYELDPCRRLIVLTNEEDLPNHYTLVCKSNRMSAVFN